MLRPVRPGGGTVSGIPQVPKLYVRPIALEGARSLRGVGPPDMVIDQILPQGGITLVTGQKYTSKTFFALEAARAVATGEPFMGRWKVMAPGNVLIVEQDSPRYDTGRALWALLANQFHEESEEDRSVEGSCVDPIYVAWHPDLNLQNRLDAMRVADTAKKLYTFRGEGLYLTNQIDETPGGSFITSIAKEEHDWGYRGARLIILDSARSLHRGEENDSGEMENFVQNVKFIRKETGAAIIIIAHDSAIGTRTRGSTALDAGVDSEYAITKRKKSRDYGLFVRKGRGIEPPEFRYTISTEELPEIGTVKKVEFKEFILQDGDDDHPDTADAPPPGSISPEPEMGYERMLSLLAQGPMTRTGEGGLVEWAQGSGYSIRSLDRWLKEAVASGYLSTSYKQEGRVRYVTYSVRTPGEKSS